MCEAIIVANIGVVGEEVSVIDDGIIAVKRVGLLLPLVGGTASRARLIRASMEIGFTGVQRWLCFLPASIAVSASFALSKLGSISSAFL